MGSFNISCFASLQTIRPGDKCRVVAIRQSGSYSPAQIAHEGGRLSLYGVASSDCFANAFWQPISMLIEAKYDDCGRVSLELEGGAGARTRRQVLGLLRRLVAENLQIGGEERGAPARTFDLVQFAQEHAPAVLAVLQDGEADGAALAASEIQKCWDYVWAAAQSYRLFTTDGYRGWRPLQFSVLHENAYEELVALCERTPRYDCSVRTMAGDVQRAVASAWEYVEDCEEAAQGESTSQKTAVDVSSYFFGQHVQGRLFPGSEGGLRCREASRHVYDKARKVFMGELTEELLLQEVKPELSDVYAVDSMNTLGIRFSPVVYAGQDYDNSVGRGYAAFVGNVCDRVMQGLEDEVKEDLEEDFD